MSNYSEQVRKSSEKKCHPEFHDFIIECRVQRFENLAHTLNLSRSSRERSRRRRESEGQLSK